MSRRLVSALDDSSGRVHNARVKFTKKNVVDDQGEVLEGEEVLEGVRKGITLLVETTTLRMRVG